MSSSTKTTDQNAGQQRYQQRRATSLGKGHLSRSHQHQHNGAAASVLAAGSTLLTGNALAAARLARTSSWSDGLATAVANNGGGASINAHPHQQVVVDSNAAPSVIPSSGLVVAPTEGPGGQQQLRPRTSMRRMVRFRMSAISGNVGGAASSSEAIDPLPLISSETTGSNGSGKSGRSESSSSPGAVSPSAPAVGVIMTTSAAAPASTTATILAGNDGGSSNRSASLLFPWQPAAVPQQQQHQGEVNTAQLPPTVSSSLPAVSGVEAATQTRVHQSWNPSTGGSNPENSNSNQEQQQQHPPRVVRQVSRFSVMQADESGGVPVHQQSRSGGHAPLESVPSVASTVLSYASSIDQPVSRSSCGRQRGRHGRRREGSSGGGHHSRARRQRSNMSTATSASVGTTATSRASSPDTSAIPRRRRHRNAEGNVDPEEESRRKQGGIWPHGLSPMFALLAATLGLFNIARFALLTVEYGGNFIVQFVLLSFLFGVPMLCFHGSLGQFLGSNVIDMWRISPIFKGVGLALLIGQAVGGLYSVVGVAWMFFYFRDSFIAQEDRYKWSKCNDQIRGCVPPTNYSFGLEETIPDYFHAKVLQRSNPSVPPLSFVSLKFELAFNLAVIWMIVFVALGKGLRSYGKVVYAFGTLPLLGFFIVCVKVLGYSSGIPSTLGFGGVLERTPWNEFFIDTRVWVIAAREVFMTWGVCGAIVMQITSHNRYSHALRRDLTIVIGLTLFTLLLSGFLASACLQIINYRGPYDYRTDSSYETDRSYRFLRSLRFMRQGPQGYGLDSNHGEFHNNLVMGIAVRRNNFGPSIEDGPGDRSGYTPLRLATELFPTLVSVIGPMEFSPFWAVLFYFSLVAFGIAQQLAIWHCVISGIVAFRSCCLKSWETTITFCTCLIGFVFSLPLATELGASIVYHLDYVMGSMWWMMIIYVVQIAAVLIVRGRPYNGESIVAVLIKGPGCLANWAVPMLAFSWSVVLPIGLLVLAVASFKTGNFTDMFNWNMNEGYAYWPLWARQAGTMLQLIPVLVIPAAGIVQCVRYLSSGPPDLFERIKLLYRPHFRTYLIPPDPSAAGASSGGHGRSRSSRSQHRDRQRRRSSRSRSRSPSPNSGGNRTSFPDPPPKYTPPPTYNTATGARIAKMLRESIRRSIRQIREMATPVQSPGNTVTSMAAMISLSGPGGNSSDVETGGPSHHQLSVTSVGRHNPPAYTSVVMELHRHGPNDPAHGHHLMNGEDSTSCTELSSSSSSSSSGAACSTTDISSSSTSSSSGVSSTSDDHPMSSAAELTRFLRESFRRSARNTAILRNSFRFMRSSSTAASSKPPDKPLMLERSSSVTMTDDDETGNSSSTDTDQGGGSRQLMVVAGGAAARGIHRDPTLANVVVNLPAEPSESVA